MKTFNITDKNDLVYDEVLKKSKAIYSVEDVEKMKLFFGEKKKDKNIMTLLEELKIPFKDNCLLKKESRSFFENDHSTLYSFYRDFFEMHTYMSDRSKFLMFSELKGFSFFLLGKMRETAPIKVNLYLNRSSYFTYALDLEYYPTYTLENISEDIFKLMIDQLINQDNTFEISKYRGELKIPRTFMEELAIIVSPDTVKIIEDNCTFSIKDIREIVPKRYNTLTRSEWFSFLPYLEGNNFHRKFIKNQLKKGLLLYGPYNIKKRSKIYRLFQFSIREIENILKMWKKNRVRLHNTSLAAFCFNIIKYQKIYVTVNTIQYMFDLFDDDAMTYFLQHIKKDKVVMNKLEKNKDLKLLLLLQ